MNPVFGQEILTMHNATHFVVSASPGDASGRVSVSPFCSLWLWCTIANELWKFLCWALSACIGIPAFDRARDGQLLSWLGLHHLDGFFFRDPAGRGDYKSCLVSFKGLTKEWRSSISIGQGGQLSYILRDWRGFCDNVVEAAREEGRN